ncbi:MAG: glycosyltransferase [Bacteroidaceae bacterium]
MVKTLHVVCLQVPYPPSYGGAIDMYYKLQALKRRGFRLLLHTYAYRHAPFREALAEVADEVRYYRRTESWRAACSPLPYTVCSRADPRLLADLLADDAPILFEGLHTCLLLAHPALAGRVKLVRTHNVEHRYYRHLALAARHPGRALFFWLESVRLAYAEPRLLRHADCLLPLSRTEAAYFRRRYGVQGVDVRLLPCFFRQDASAEAPASARGLRRMVLYQGNLSVDENVRAARFVVRHVAPLVPEAEFVVAGARPPHSLVRAAARSANVRLVADPSDEVLRRLLTEARVNLLLTFQATGVKLKLLNALRQGAYCVANPPMVEGTGLESLCLVADGAEALARAVRRALARPYTPTFHRRKFALLGALYSNERGAAVVEAAIRDAEARK